MTDIVKVALIAAAPGLVTAIISAFNHVKLTEVAKKADGLTDKLVAVEKVVSFKEGVAAEKERRDV
jgi:hypothetical protein